MAATRTLTLTAGITNLVAAVAWLMVYGAAGLMCFASLAVAVGFEPRTFVFVPVCSVFALLWVMLSIHGLVRPAALRTGRWFMTGIAIGLAVAGSTGWLRDAACYGVVATVLSVAAVVMNIWAAVSTGANRET